MARHVEIRLLGDVSVVVDGEPVVHSSLGVRTVLALLALDPGMEMSGDELIDELWSDGSRPQNPRPALQVQVSRLRTWLGGDAPRDRYVRGERGAYVLDLPPERIDLHRFHELATQALHPTTTARDPAELAADALSLWRGEPFSGCIGGPRLAAARARAEERLLRLRDR